MQHKPIIPWIGGKRKLAKHLLPRFPKHTCYAEVFCGGAALFFLKNRSKVEVINDINGDIVNLYRVVKYHLDEFLQQFDLTLISRDFYAQMQSTSIAGLTDIQRAARFYYLQKMAFGGKVTNQAFGIAANDIPSFNLLNIKNDLTQANIRLKQVYIENLSWEKLIDRYDKPETFFYCDPPPPPPNSKRSRSFLSVFLLKSITNHTQAHNTKHL